MKKLNTSLSKEQAAFAVLIEEKAPYLLPLWDFDKREYRPSAVDSFLTLASHGECIMARFFLGIWRHDNYYKFDYIEAVKVLDKRSIKVITDWMNSPIFP